MKFKRIIKSVFITILAFILVSLALIAFGKLGTTDVNVQVMDYRIVNENVSEPDETLLEEIYRDDKYIYYLKSVSSNNYYLEWNNGEKTRMMDDLKKGKVTIYSLINHGIDVYKENINEE